jgi:CelD/BcsL family acetyltransferase involved in cellulose biosynthesis
MNGLLHRKSPARPAAEIHVISDTEGFDALETEWEALHAAAGVSVFQSFIWQRCWWRHHGEGFCRRLLHLVTVREADELIAVAPFYIEEQRHNSLASTRTLRFVGTELSDHLDIILHPDREKAAINALAGYLALLWTSLDAIELVDIPDESPVHKRLGAALAAAGLPVSVEICDRCPRIALAATWEETLAATSGDFRKKLRVRTERLTAHETVGFEIIGDPSDFDVAMDDFVLLHQNRMVDKVGSGVYSHERNEGFHREVCREMFRRGWLFMCFLTLNGRRVLGNCYYFLNGRVYCHLGGALDMGEAWKHSPGIVFESYCMQEALHRGARVYDFLRGTESYKYRLGAVEVPNWRLSAKRVRPSVKLFKPVGQILSHARRLLILLALIAPFAQFRMFRHG